jgi:predicted AAA+ superfamily ATPase
MDDVLPVLTRIAEALERLAPAPPDAASLDGADAFVWHGASRTLSAVASVSGVALGLLRGIDRQRDLVVSNTVRFARGRPANNAMLWGSRGMGKSSLVKAAHRAANEERPGSLALVEIARDELATLPSLLAMLRAAPGRRVIVFCDDLSFDGAAGDPADYKALKSVLDGGIEGRPGNVLFYCTSNRRHLMARDMIDNERGTAINPGEAVEEKVSLSDRFGLSVGFHHCDQSTFFAMVEGYASAMGLAVSAERLRAEANEWAMTRGGRSGRVAAQFIDDLAGRLEEETV